MRVAVVGSGIAGLSAAFLLSEQHDVTLFEKADHLGMDAHALDIGTARVDVPLRVFFEGFYPNVIAMYRALGIRFEPINYSASFGLLERGTYFRFDNYRFGRYAVPFLKGRGSFLKTGLRIGLDNIRFFRKTPRDLVQGLSNSLTLAEYLARENYSDAFAEGFVYPAFAGICTCSRESVKSYPARVILEYLNSNLLLSSVQRVVDGTQEVVERLAANVRKRQLGVDVTGITRASNHAIVHVNDNEFPFDHVIIATQANQALDLLNESASKERAVLESFKYESSRVVVHSDPALAPASGPKHWAPVNFLMANKQSTPMATIWLNAIQNIGSDEPIFQTWNPIVEPRAEHVIGESTFERPVVNEESLAALSKLNALHDQPDRRVWFVGSYASHGIPLLESATTSAMRVAAHLGCQPSWQSDSSPIMLDGLSVSRASG